MTATGRQAFLALSILIVVGADFIIDNWPPYLCAVVVAYCGGGLAAIIHICDRKKK